MKATLTSFASGIVFALGLGISGMTRPVKVIGFLDFFGKWDASLAFVMIGAIAVYSVAYRLSNTMKSPLLAPVFSIPRRSDFDSKLILGAAIFGAGWAWGCTSIAGSMNLARKPPALSSSRSRASRMHRKVLLLRSLSLTFLVREQSPACHLPTPFRLTLKLTCFGSSLMIESVPLAVPFTKGLN
jgi:hypothetical protein